MADLPMDDDKTIAISDKKKAQEEIDAIENEQTRVHRGLDDLEGEVISGRYLIVRRIGKGGMGVVYLAQQTNLNRNVCIKVLNPALLDDEDAVGRFEREAKGLSRLQHPNIVTIFDYGRDRNLAYIVMEYAQGETLSKYMKSRGAMNLNDFLPIAVYTLKGIGEAHKMGLIHRDIKPANIILSELEGEKFVKILDFGLAKLAQGGEDLTKEQQLVGSASYMAPEQILTGTSDTRTDVYALGVMFYFMIAGKKPFVGTNDNVVLYKHVNEDPVPLHNIIEPSQGIPESLCEVIDLCLSKDPDKRPQTALELLSAVSSALNAPELKTGFSPISLGHTDSANPIEKASPSVPAGSPPPSPQQQQQQNETVPSAASTMASDDVSAIQNFDRMERETRDRKMLFILLFCVVAVISVLTYLISSHLIEQHETQIADNPENGDNVFDNSLGDIELPDSKNDESSEQNASDNISKAKKLIADDKLDEAQRLADESDSPDEQNAIVGLILMKKAENASVDHPDEAIGIYQQIIHDEKYKDLKTDASDKLSAYPLVTVKFSGPSDAHFMMDGKEIPIPEDGIHVSRGHHSFEVKKSGFTTDTQEADIKEDYVLNLKIESVKGNDSNDDSSKSSKSSSPKPSSGSSSKRDKNGLLTNKKGKKSNGLL